MKKILLATLAALCAFSVLRADPVKLTNSQAKELWQTLSSIDAGLSAANTTAVADDILALQPKVEAFEKGNMAAAKRLGVVPTTRLDDPAGVKYLAELEQNQEVEITVELTRLEISADELTAAKIRPSVLAVVRRYLKPLPKK